MELFDITSFKTIFSFFEWINKSIFANKPASKWTLSMSIVANNISKLMCRDGTYNLKNLEMKIGNVPIFVRLLSKNVVSNSSFSFVEHRYERFFVIETVRNI